MGFIKQSRFSTKATVVNGKTKRPVRLKRRHVELLKSLAPYPHLTIPYVSRLSEYSHDYLYDLIREFKREHNDYLKVPDHQIERFSLNERLAYSLTDKARALLADEYSDIRFHTNEFAGPFTHQLYATSLRAAFDIAARDIDHVSIVGHDELLKDSRVPIYYKESPTPHYVPIPKELWTKDHKKLIPDCYPFVLKNELLPHGKNAFPLIIEADTGSHTIETNVRAMVRRYAWFFDTKKYKDLWGFPDCYVCIVTATDTRVQNIIDKAIMPETDHRRHLRRHFLLTSAPVPGRVGYDAKIIPNPVTAPWRVAGRDEPFYFYREKSA